MPNSSITNPNYKENPEMDCKCACQYQRNIDLFKHTGRVLHPITRKMYEYIKNFCIDHVKNHPQFPKFNWKPKICDVGCGGGFGSNILSQEGDFVWGIDIDEESIKWAQQLFTRHKNNVYYNCQLTFDVIDIRKEPREIMPFDIVACIELIEHIDDYEKVLAFLKRLCKKDKKGNYLEPPMSTIVFISSPNRNNPNCGDDSPKNKRHVREWTPDELYAILIKHFKHVDLLDSDGEPQELSTIKPDILFRCETPL